MTFYNPIGDFPPRKWCGCAHFIWCNHTYPNYAGRVWTTTDTSWPWGEKRDDGYVGRHRKEV